MKKILYTLTFVLIACVAMANHRNSDLHIQMFNGTPIKVFIDGRLVSYQPQPAVLITDLVPGNHVVRVVQPHLGFNGYSMGPERVLFQGNVFIEEGAEIHSEVDPNGRLRITQVIQHDFQAMGHDDYYYNDYDAPCHHDHAGHHYGWSQGHGYGYGRSVISDREFQDIRAQVRDASFESTRLTIAKRAISGRRLSAVQVRELVEAFSFESTKVEFAKFAYPMVVDKERFYMVYDAFNFNSSIDELDDFISRQGF